MGRFAVASAKANRLEASGFIEVRNNSCGVSLWIAEVWMMKYRHQTCRKAGFTLIEVLVVVAIIALLVAVFLPSLKKARESAQGAVCASQMLR